LNKKYISFYYDLEGNLVLDYIENSLINIIEFFISVKFNIDVFIHRVLFYTPIYHKKSIKLIDYINYKFQIFFYFDIPFYIVYTTRRFCIYFVLFFLFFVDLFLFTIFFMGKKYPNLVQNFFIFILAKIKDFSVKFFKLFFLKLNLFLD
jgi:hypothetical protein